MKALKEILNKKAKIYPFHPSPRTSDFIDNEIKAAVKEWLGQWRSDPKGIQTVDEVGQIQLEFLEELERSLGEVQEGQ
jgi:hypothetical protein